MKKLVLGLGAALAMIAAAPSFAQPNHATRQNVQRLEGVRAQALPAYGSDAVFVDGQQIGADPDPNVRLELQKDYPSVVNR